MTGDQSIGNASVYRRLSHFLPFTGANSDIH